MSSLFRLTGAEQFLLAREDTAFFEVAWLADLLIKDDRHSRLSLDFYMHALLHQVVAGNIARHSRVEISNLVRGRGIQSPQT